MKLILSFSIWLFVILLTSGSVTAADKLNSKIDIHKNIVYTTSKQSPEIMTSLDIYTNKRIQNSKKVKQPVMIWVHGGGWCIGDKIAVQMKPKIFNQKGFVFVSLNYQLFPMVDYVDQTNDIAKAIHWVHDNINKFGGNPDHIYIMGHSAGAHLASLVTTNERYLKTEKLPLTTIKGVILLDGAGYDIPRQLNELDGPIIQKLYKTVFGTDKKTLIDASPINHISKNKGIPPFLILYVANRENSKIQSEGLANQLKKSEISATVIPASNKNHATINREIGKLNDEPTKEIFKFLKQIEKN